MKEYSHVHFCKNILEGRGETQNNFVYGELGRTSHNNPTHMSWASNVKNAFAVN